MFVRRCAVLALPITVWAFSSSCGFSFDLDGRCFQGDPCADAGPPPGTDVDLNPDGDDDQDGVKNAGDSCRAVWNPTQLDYDADGVGDECDPCPFVPNGEAPCYERWEVSQLDGVWEGYQVTHGEAAGLLDTPPRTTVSPLSVTLAAGSWSPSEKPSDTRAATLANSAVLTLARLGGSDGDGALLVDARREVLVGQVFQRKGGGEGRAGPPNLVVLLRKRRFHDGVLANQPIPETRAPPAKPAGRSWRLHGVLDQDGLLSRRYSLQAAFQTLVSEKALDIQGDDGKSSGRGYAFDARTGVLASEKAALSFSTGGDLRETLDETRLSIPLSSGPLASLELRGRISFSRDVAVFGVSGLEKADDTTSAFFVLTETDPLPVDGAGRALVEDGQTDARLHRWAFLGLHRDASVRGYIPDAPTTDSVVGVQLHDAGQVSATIVQAASGFAGADFVGLNLPTQLAAPLTSTLDEPRTCLLPTPGGALALAVMCRSQKVLVSLGCPIDVECPMTFGLGVALDAAHPDSDYDLDGRGTANLQASDPCSGGGDDPCPCAVNPLEDCP